MHRFHDPNEPCKGRIRQLAEGLDAHRKARQALYPGLTLTGMYNVLEKLRRGEPLTPKEKFIHEQGLVSVLRRSATNATPRCRPPMAGTAWPRTRPRQ